MKIKQKQIGLQPHIKKNAAKADFSFVLLLSRQLKLTASDE